MTKLNNLFPAELLRHIVNHPINYPKDYTYIILGGIGPTGKSYLCSALQKNGYKAFDISEDTFDLVDYRDYGNVCRVNHVQHHVMIMLNRRFNLKGE